MSILPRYSSAPYIPICNKNWNERERRDKFEDNIQGSSSRSSDQSLPNEIPWKRRPYYCGIIGLHEEIEDFYETMRPTNQETELRLRVVEHITRIVHSLWPLARVEIFGSFRTGLYLPSSDIDLVVLGEWCNLPLYTLSKALERSGIASKDIYVIPKATVPVVRILHTPSRIKVDIAFNKENGIKGAKLIKDLMREHPALPKLVLVLKQFLLNRDLNEVYSGGLSSYCLTLLIVSLLQGYHKPKSEPSSNIGTLLIEFFEHYGINFNYKNVSIHFQNGGSYKPKINNSKDLLSVEDPLTKGHDIASGTYLIDKIKLAFQNAFLHLNKAVTHSTTMNVPSPSFLNLILNVSHDALEQRQWMVNNYSVILRSLSSLTEISSGDQEAIHTSTGKKRKKIR